MFAVIKTGGKQYKVQEGDVLQIEKLSLEKDKKVVFDQVLLIDDEEKTLIGTPFVENAQVQAVVLENFKDDKVIVFKKKRRKQYRKKTGHRQELTKLRVEKIVSGKEPLDKKEQEEAEKKTEKKVASKTQKEKVATKETAKEEKPEKKAVEKPVKKKGDSKAKVKAAEKEKPAVKAPKRKQAKKKVAVKTKKSSSSKE